MEKYILEDSDNELDEMNKTFSITTTNTEDISTILVDKTNTKEAIFDKLPKSKKYEYERNSLVVQRYESEESLGILSDDDLDNNDLDIQTFKTVCSIDTSNLSTVSSITNPDVSDYNAVIESKTSLDSTFKCEGSSDLSSSQSMVYASTPKSEDVVNLKPCYSDNNMISNILNESAPTNLKDVCFKSPDCITSDDSLFINDENCSLDETVVKICPPKDISITEKVTPKNSTYTGKPHDETENIFDQTFSFDSIFSEISEKKENKETLPKSEDVVNLKPCHPDENKISNILNEGASTNLKDVCFKSPDCIISDDSLFINDENCSLDQTVEKLCPQKNISIPEKVTPKNTTYTVKPYDETENIFDQTFSFDSIISEISGKKQNKETLPKSEDAVNLKPCYPDKNKISNILNEGTSTNLKDVCFKSPDCITSDDSLFINDENCSLDQTVEKLCPQKNISIPEEVTPKNTTYTVKPYDETENIFDQTFSFDSIISEISGKNKSNETLNKTFTIESSDSLDQTFILDSSISKVSEKKEMKKTFNKTFTLESLKKKCKEFGVNEVVNITKDDIISDKTCSYMQKSMNKSCRKSTSSLPDYSSRGIFVPKKSLKSGNNTISLLPKHTFSTNVKSASVIAEKKLLIPKSGMCKKGHEKTTQIPQQRKSLLSKISSDNTSTQKSSDFHLEYCMLQPKASKRAVKSSARKEISAIPQLTKIVPPQIRSDNISNSKSLNIQQNIPKKQSSLRAARMESNKFCFQSGHATFSKHINLKKRSSLCPPHNPPKDISSLKPVSGMFLRKGLQKSEFFEAKNKNLPCSIKEEKMNVQFKGNSETKGQRQGTL